MIWDAARRVKLGRIGPCRRRRWGPFRTPCACTGVMLPIHRVSDGSMLFPTELGGGNDSRIAAIYRGDLCDMACNRPCLSFPAGRNDAGGGNFRNPKRGVPRVFRQFPTALPCIMEPRRETIPVKRCVGCLRPVLRRGASASMPSLHPGDMREHASFCFCTYFFRRLVCGEFQRKRLCRDGVAGGIPRCLVSHDGVA